LRARLADQDIEIAHLKMTLAPRQWPDLAAVSLTGTGDEPEATHLLAAPLSAGELMVNLRAEADPELLKARVLEELGALPQAFELQNVAAFRPGRPTPTHRLRATGKSGRQRR
jgi:hypothetical protein